MKSIFKSGKITGLVLTAILLAACSGDNENHHQNGMSETQESAGDPLSDRRADSDVPNEVAAMFDEMLNSYLELTGSLVDTDADISAAHSERLHGLSGQFMQLVRNQNMTELETVASVIEVHSGVISNEGDVEEQRSAYENLSDAMITMVENIGHQKEALYHQRCPMVNGGNGDWLSTNEQILNPYHGTRMLNCGSTIREM